MKRALLFLLPGLLLVGCGDLESSGIVDTSKKLIDKATPTESARARRAGFVPGQKVFFVTEIDGKRKSSGWRIRKDTSFREKPAELLETEQNFTMVSRMGEMVRQQVVRRLITGYPDGEAMYLSEAIKHNGKLTTKSITITENEAVFNEKSGASQDSFSMPVPKGVLFSINPRWILNRRPDIGNSYTAQVIDRENRRVVSETAMVRNRTEEDVLGVKMEVWQVEIRREGFAPTRLAFTNSGDIVRLTAENMQSMVVTEDVASRDEAKMEVINSVPMSFPLPAWDNFNRIVTRPMPFTRWKPYLQDSNYNKTNGQELILYKNAPSVSMVSLPMQVPTQLQGYLVSSDGIRPDDGDIRDMAQDIISRQNNALQAVALLAGWVFQNISYDFGATANNSAVDTLRTRSGDSLAHADLFASLCRSLGIPTRHCSGLLLQRDNAGMHVWCEVWLGGVWVPVDTTVNRVGLPAGYILMATGDGTGVPASKFAWVLREGGMGLEVTSATKVHNVPGTGKQESFTLYPGQKKTYVGMASNKDWLANIYWGFSMIKPKGWDGKINLDSVTITSPDGAAVVKIEALNKVLPCTAEQLDAVISSLEREAKLPGFHRNNQGIVRFGKRLDSALFIDFSVEQPQQSRRCQMYIIPKRGRSYRITAWGPAVGYDQWLTQFKAILDSVSL